MAEMWKGFRLVEGSARFSWASRALQASLWVCVGV